MNKSAPVPTKYAQPLHREHQLQPLNARTPPPSSSGPAPGRCPDAVRFSGRPATGRTLRRSESTARSRRHGEAHRHAPAVATSIRHPQAPITWPARMISASADLAVAAPPAPRTVLLATTDSSSRLPSVSAGGQWCHRLHACRSLVGVHAEVTASKELERGSRRRRIVVV